MDWELPMVSPALAADQFDHETNYVTFVAAPPKEGNIHLINHSYKKGFSPSMPPTPVKVQESSNTVQIPSVSPSSFSGSSPMMSHVPHIGKQPSNVTDAPLSPHAGLSRSSPAMSPEPYEMKPPSNAHAPMPREANEASNTTLAPSPLHLHPLESSPGISPAPHEVNNSPQPSRSAPSISPASHEVKEPSNFTGSSLPSHTPSLESSPVTSPTPPEAKEPTNTTHSPIPSEYSPMISPAPHEVMQPSNNTHAPSASHPKYSGLSPSISPTPHEVNNSPQPSRSTPSISPAPHEVKEPSNFTSSPHPLHSPPPESSPATCPTPPEAKEPTNTTHSPIPPPPLPSEHSPMISPAPHEVMQPSNNTHAPSASHPKYSGLSPSISPTPHDGEDPKNITHSPPPLRPFPSESPPAISPASHEVTAPSNNTQAPSASPPELSGSSPAISPTPHEVKVPPNITHSPLPSHPFPSESPPAISPASHEVTTPSNNTQAPLASPPELSGSSPAISPTPHDVKKPSNITHSPLPSHPHPSGSAPPISPAPHEVNNPSITHPPLASSPKSSEMSPVISPTPHEVKDNSNISHSPLPSNLTPSEFPPVHAPPYDLSNTTHSPSASHPILMGPSPAISPTPHESNEPTNGTISPLPLYPSQSPPVISPAPHEKEASNSTHSPMPSHPHPSEYSPAAGPVPQGAKDQSNVTHAPLASVSSPLISPVSHEVKNHSSIVHAPVPSHPHPPSGGIQSPASAPASPQKGTTTTVGNPAIAPSSNSPPSSRHQGPMISPASSHRSAVPPSNEQTEHASSPHIQGPSISPVQAPSNPPVIVPEKNQSEHSPSAHPQAPSVSPIQAAFPPVNRDSAHSPSPSETPPSHSKWPIHPPILPPRFPRKAKAPSPRLVWAFPPPPPNSDCKPLSCQEPVTYPPPGSLCVCVLPIRVGLQLSVALYTFFPLVSELAQEIASGIFVKQSQVRVMGANAATEDPEKTIVLIDVVPLGRSFDMNTALLIFERLWHKQVLIKASYFGDYDVLYVRYPGLPSSPPTAAGVSIDGGTLTSGENARTLKPFGVDVRKRKEKLSGSIIAIIVVTSVIALVISVGAAWLLLLKRRRRSDQPPPTSQQPLSPFARPSGTGQTTLGSGPSSTSASYESSIAATGSAKTFSLAEIERATDKFNESRIIGEGGFGRVYQGTLEDGTMVAVKVLKRADHQGGREFLAEVEMLSRLHHRNLVKLIGICTEESARCLVYELIPNGSVESHLHGSDKQSSPLDWNARMKIALGAARGLAYLHEDSSPRVIHRDFKSSNILLEQDFTPKVSDFGLARTALDEGKEQISTRVMGTFGYVAPEYAMTGHLLVKSDVYSYGVVLLELLTGRKPVDMSQPPGQENLVSWARPLLTSMEGLEKLIDPTLTSVPVDSVAKVAAIASMCVQPEVSHRPFMGEVVQALRLVCNEGGEHGGSLSQDESSTKDSDIITGSGHEEERVMSESDIFCTSAAFAKDASGSFRRYYSSGPLKMGGSQNPWEKVRGFSSGSMVENRGACRPGSGLEGGDHWV